MRTILRGFMGGMDVEELFPRRKKAVEAGMGTASDQLNDLVAGIQAGFGKEAADAAVAQVAKAFPHPPEEYSPASEYLNTSLVNLTSQYDTDEIIASLRKIAKDVP